MNHTYLKSTASSLVHHLLILMGASLLSIVCSASQRALAQNPGDILITEFRFHGSAGASDEFIELYNNTDSNITVSTSDGSAGWALVATNHTGTSITTRFVIPNGTVIPARGHYLGVNNSTNGYSLSAYPAGNGTTATGDINYSSSIANDGGIALFKTAKSANFMLANRFDAAGFQGISGTTLYTEGTGLTPSSGITTNGEYSFVRKLNPETRLPQDTNDNEADFIFISTTGGIFSTRASKLGAPGPENLSSPINGVLPGAAAGGDLITPSPLDSTHPVNAAPNEVRDPTQVTNGAHGTLSLRRTFTNNSSVPVTQLRFRVIDLTTLPSPAGTADLRLLTSSDVMVTVGGNPVTVRGTTLETPPAQAKGGGINSTFSVSAVSPATPLAPGDSVSVQFLFGINQEGQEGTEQIEFDRRILLCSFLISPTNQDFTADGGSMDVNVTTGACQWAAMSNASFITINPSGGGTGNGTVNFTVGMNTGSARSGTMTIAGKTFTVTQQGAPADLVVSKMASSGSVTVGSNLTYTIKVTNNGPNSADVVMVGDSLPANTSFVSCDATSGGVCGGSGGNRTVTFPSLASGGSATITLVVSVSCSAANGAVLSNTAVITSSNTDPQPGNNSSMATATVSNPSAITPTDQSFTAAGGGGTINLTALNTCNWTAVSSNPDFIMITSDSTGMGNGAVTFSVGAHSNTFPRTGTISLAGQTFTILQGAQFKDVPSGHQFYAEIGKLSARGVTLGCGGGNFCPDSPVTREQMAALLLRAKGIPNPPMPNTQRFGDVPSSNSFFAFIEQMAVLQITQGCGGGNYCPTGNVTREQMAAFIIRALGDLNPNPPASPRFADVPPENSFYAFIEQMAVRGITQGCGGGNYCPASDVTRGQMAAFLVRAFGL